MTNKTEKTIEPYLRKDLPNIRPGDTVRIHQKMKLGKQERIQIFEGIVLARKHGKGVSATITVRKDFSGIGVEKIFPLHSPTIEKMEIVKRGKVRRAKIYHIREAKGRKARLRKVEIKGRRKTEEKVEEPKEKDKEEKKEESEKKPEVKKDVPEKKS